MSLETKVHEEDRGFRTKGRYYIPILGLFYMMQDLRKENYISLETETKINKVKVIQAYYGAGIIILGTVTTLLCTS